LELYHILDRLALVVSGTNPAIDSLKDNTGRVADQQDPPTPLSEKRVAGGRRDNEEFAGEAARGEELAGGVGNRGGRGGRIVGERCVGGQESFNDDFEPEGDDPRSWKRYYRRQLRRQKMRMMENMSAILGNGTQQTSTGRTIELKAPQPRKFKGEAHDVYRFLRQCENNFSIKASSFLQETIRIC
jgi:hypothetical protein